MLSYAKAREAISLFDGWIQDEFHRPRNRLYDKLWLLDNELKDLKDELRYKERVFASEMRSQWYVVRNIEPFTPLDDYEKRHEEFCEELKKEIAVLETRKSECKKLIERYEEVTKLRKITTPLLEGLIREEKFVLEEYRKKKMLEEWDIYISDEECTNF